MLCVHKRIQGIPRLAFIIKYMEPIEGTFRKFVGYTFRPGSFNLKYLVSVTSGYTENRCRFC